MTAPGRPTPPSLAAWLGEHTEGLIAIRRNIHAHPELSGEEKATTELVAERLRIAGLQPRILTNETGIVCDLRPPGTAGPLLAFRADLDALAMQDETETPYRSQVPGVAHACGHDVHTAIVLGVALYFAHHVDELAGGLRFIFQPAEERVPGGAVDVIADGGLDGVGGIVGIHCMPKMDVGTVGLRSGPITSAGDMAQIWLAGPGGHTARPEETVDLITIAARVVDQLPGRVKEALGDPDQVKVVFGSIRAGDAGNVIPSTCAIRASIRTPSSELWRELPKIVDASLAGLLDRTGTRYSLEYTSGVPPVIADEATVSLVRRAAVAEFGATNVLEAEQSWGGDDFAWYTQQVRSAFVRLGTHDPRSAGPHLDLHAGHFDVDERVIPIGVRLLAAAALAFFG